MTRKEKVKKAKIGACSQGKSVGKRSEAPVLYDEIIFNILMRLSAMCLHGIMRYVCNTWAQLIRSPHFVESHLQLQQSRHVLFVQEKHRTPFRARILEFKENGDFEINNLNTPIPCPVSCSFDGLIVFPDPSKKVLCVVNPIIMDVAEVPLCFVPHSVNYYHYGIARCPNVGYKLVCGHFEKNSEGLTSWYALSLGMDDAWRKIGSVVLRSPEWIINRSIAIGQFIYWVKSCRRYNDLCEVVVVDTANESVSKFSFPKGLRIIGFMKVGNYLACVKMSGYQYFVYVSKDVHLRKWEFYHKVVPLPPRGYAEWYVIQFIACLGQELIVLAGRDDYKQRYSTYNMRTGQVTWLEGYTDGFYDLLHVHTNSLVSWRSF